MQKKVLVVSYTFPPNPGVGGRRWAKFVKYLDRYGFDIKVIKSSNMKHEMSNWTDDVKALKKDQVVDIPPMYPKYLSGYPKSFLLKVLYRLSLVFVKITTKGNYYDRTSFWKQKLVKEVKKQIQLGYNTIIVSCPPFKMAYDISKLKQIYPEVKFILDMRDPWDVNSSIQGFPSMSSIRKKYEEQIHKKTIYGFDKVLTVNDHMTNFYMKFYSDRKEDFVTISNGFDKDDFKGISDEVLPANDKITFVFAGSFYPGTKELFQEFLSALTQMRKVNKRLYLRLDIKFYGNVPEFFKAMIKPHKEALSFEGELPLKQIYTKIKQSDYVMLFLLDDITYSFSTKFYEYLSQNKPIVLFSKEGSSGRYIEEKGLGHFIKKGEIYEQFLELVSGFSRSAKKKPLDKIDISKHDVENITKELIKVIES